MLVDKRLHFSARTAPVAPQVEQLADLGHGESEVACGADEAKYVHIGVRVHAVIGAATLWLLHEADCLVVADHLGGHAQAQRLLR